jgi:hypothetical protein
MALAQESGCRWARSEDCSYEVEESKRLVISFPATDANFYATVRSDADLTETLLMVLTYNLS